MTIKLIGIAMLVLTQLLDWHSTLAFLRSGKGYETNGWLRRLQARIGPGRAMILKSIAHAPIAIAIWLWPQWVVPGLMPYLVIYVLIVRKNYRIARGG